nr:MAG TPA: hypothetical protein [Caudoviricetes sp.]
MVLLLPFYDTFGVTHCPYLHHWDKYVVIDDQTFPAKLERFYNTHSNNLS